MSLRSFHTPLPAIAPFEDIAAMLRPPAPQFTPLSPREETHMEVLALEIVQCAPMLAELLVENGMRRLREELSEA